jgi:hypothetical protein
LQKGGRTGLANGGRAEERLSAFCFFFVEADNKLPIGVSMKVN